MKKKAMGAGLVFALSLFLAACQTQTPQTGIRVNEKTKEAKILSFFAPVEMEWTTGASFRDLVLEYNDTQNGVQITFDGVATADGYDSFLEERLDAADAVDIFVVNAENVKEIAQKEQFHDLSGGKSFDLLSESAKEQATIDGVAYTIPLQMAVYVMDVNVSLLERHGLAVPRNYDEFLHCCQVLKAQGVTPISLNRWYAMTAPVMTRGLYPVYQAENREQLIAGLNSGEIKIGDYMIEGFRMFEQFVKEGYYGDNLTMEEVDTLRADTRDKENFTNGRTAFRFCAAFNLQPTKMENGDSCIFAAIPMLPDGGVTMPSIATRLCVNAGTKDLEDAVKLVDFIVGKRVEVIARDAADPLSPFHAISASNTRLEWQQDLLRLMDGGRQVPIEDMNVHFGFWDNTRALCLKIIGGMTAEEAAQEFNRIQMEELKAYGEG